MQETLGALQEVRELASQFAAERLRPRVEHWDHARAIDADVRAQVAELGFHGMLVPVAQNGLGFGMPTCAAVLEEIAWGEPVIAFELMASATVATALVEAGVQGPRAAWLDALATGRRTGALSLAPDADTALQAEEQDGWKLSGTTRWVLHASPAPLLLATAQCGGRGDALHVVFAVEPGMVAWTARETTLGLSAARLETASLDGAAIPAEAILGSSPVLRDALARVQRVGTAAIALGIARNALEHATAYADVREQFGRKLRTFEGLQMKLADMDIRVDAARAAVYAAAADASPLAAARARVFASEAAMWVTTQAVQIFGGYGYMRDYPVEKLMRDAKATEILTGTNEMLRGLIAAGLYRD